MEELSKNLDLRCALIDEHFDIRSIEIVSEAGFDAARPNRSTELLPNCYPISEFENVDLKELALTSSPLQKVMLESVQNKFNHVLDLPHRFTDVLVFRWLSLYKNHINECPYRFINITKPISCHEKLAMVWRCVHRQSKETVTWFGLTTSSTDEKLGSVQCGLRLQTVLCFTSML